MCYDTLVIPMIDDCIDWLNICLFLWHIVIPITACIERL